MYNEIDEKCFPKQKYFDVTNFNFFSGVTSYCDVDVPTLLATSASA